MNLQTETANKPKSFEFFKQDWNKQFPWLKCEYFYNQMTNKWYEKMFCIYCQKYYEFLMSEHQKNQQNSKPQLNSMIEGTSSIKITRCSEHIQNQKTFHESAEIYYNNQGKQNPQQIIQKQAFEKLFGTYKFNIQQRLMLPLFQIAYFIAKQDLAIIKYESIKQLLKFNGVELSESYTNRVSCNQFLEEMYSIVIEDLLQDVIESQIYSISVDSTNCQNKKGIELMCISIRYVDKCFSIKEKFLQIIHLEDLSSQSYLNKVLQILKQYNLLNQIYFLCTDGAAVVASQKNGLAGRLKKEIPYLICNHCAVHKSCLGIKDLYKKYDCISNLNSKIYKLCQILNSKKRLQLLEINQHNILKDDDHENLNLIKPLDIRWVCYYPAIKRLLQNYSPVIVTLKELQIDEKDESDYIAILINYLQNIDNLLFIAIYGDILESVYVLSKSLQQKQISLKSFQVDLKICLKQLNELIQDQNDMIDEQNQFEQGDGNKIGDLLFNLIQRLSKNVEVKDNHNQFILLDNCYQIQIKHSIQQHIKLAQNMGNQIIKSLIENLQSRFDDSGFKQHYDCLDIDQIKQQNKSSIKEYGNDSLKILFEFYKQNNSPLTINMDYQILFREYQTLKYLLVGEYQKKEQQELLQIMSKTINFQTIIKFIKLYLTFPITTVEVERIFSQVNNVVTRKRNSISIELINILLMISRNGPELEDFNFAKAINNWKEDKKRYFV